MGRRFAMLVGEVGFVPGRVVSRARGRRYVEVLKTVETWMPERSSRLEIRRVSSVRLGVDLGACAFDEVEFKD
jgi:hypothetical protein